MNDLLQKHGCANVFTIPEGLKELMSDISREVLRDQPVKIYDYISNYLSVLLITREHGILATRVLDDLCDCRPSVTEHLAQIGLTEDQAAIIADIIKEEIEGFEPIEGKETVKEAQIIKMILNNVVLDEAKTAKVCQVARNAYREYWYRKKLLEEGLRTAPEEPWEIAAERTLQIYKSTKPSFSELTRATEKIQAAYRGYHVRRNLLRHLKPKKKRGPKVDLPGPPLDIAASREIDLGPLINIKVREDDVSVMFDEHATQNLGLPYDPQRAITHVEDVGEERQEEMFMAEEGERSRAPSRMVEIKSVKSFQPDSVKEAASAVYEAPPRRSRLASHIPEPAPRPSHVSELAARQSHVSELAPRQSHVSELAPRQSHVSEPEPRQSHVPEPAPRQSRLPSQVQSGHLSFVEAPPEVIPDETEGTKEGQAIAGDPASEEAEMPEPLEMPEDIPDDRTEGDGESAPLTSAPTTERTDVSDVEDVAEDVTTSGEEEGE